MQGGVSKLANIAVGLDVDDKLHSASLLFRFFALWYRIITLLVVL